MSQIQSYNALIERFKAFADGHYLIKHFSHGQIDVADLDKFPVYPFLHVIPSLVNYAEGQKTFTFDVVLADLPRDKEWKPEYQREVLSDLQRIAEDLFAEIQQNQVLFGPMIQLQNASIEPFIQEYKHVLTGWKLSFQMIVPYYWDACTTPASWNDYVTNLGGGNSTVLTFGMSTNLDETGIVTLDNDLEAPSPNHYYGTDSEGVKGWFLLPSGNTFDCADLLDCAVFTDLQTEVGLKANIVDISAVGFSNDYNDLDNLPIIPAPVTSVSIISHEVKLGSTMTKGTPVYVSSADGTNMVVSPASNTSELTSSKTMGLLMTGGAINAQVQVITEGLLAGLDTTAASIGDPVWLGSTGTLLYGIANKPVAPLHLVFIGIVTRVNNNNGEIFVKVQNGFELQEIHNVLIESVADNQVLQYESATSLWKNKTLATGLAVGTTPITSGAVGRVLFQGTGNVLQESANLFWDNTNGRLGIGTATPNNALHVIGGGFFTSSIVINNGFVMTEGGNVHTFTAPVTNRTIRFITNSQSFSLAPTGNVLIGTTTDAGYKLDVNGTARVTSSFRCDGQSTFTSSIIATAQVRIGSNPIASSSVLDVQSTTQGFLPPRMTTTQKNAIASAVAGLVVYDTTTNKLCCYNGTTWNDLF